MEKAYDVIVIGAGSAGLTAAVGFKKAGKSVLLIERSNMGGDCTNTGCIPSKSLLYHAKTYAAVRQTAGETAALADFRAQAFLYVRSKISEVLAEESPEHFRNIGITVELGEAAFIDDNAIAVNGNTFRFKKAIIASGSRARTIEVSGLSTHNTLTSENLFDLTEAPATLLVIGGGAIGLEMSQAMALLGTKVTIVVREAELGLREDPAVRAILQSRFTELGITVLTDSQVERITDGHAIVSSADGATKRIPTEKVLIAIGRTVNLPEGLSSAHVTCSDKGIVVDKNHRTTNKQIYAVGDVSNQLKFTHTADDSARQVIAHVLSKGLIRVKDKPVPKVIYIDPEMAQVGLSESEAVDAYGADAVMRIEVPYSQNDRSKTESSTTGVLVVLVKRLTGQILGVHLIGSRAGELLTVFTLAMSEKISMYKLQSLIFAYPTYSLITKKAADQFFANQLSSLKDDLKNLFGRHAVKFFAAVLWIGALVGLYIFQQVQDLSVLEISLIIFDFISMSVWGPLLYVLVYTVRPLTFFPGTFLTILSGIFFGLTGGIIYTVLGANLSAAVAYLVGRYFGSSLRFENTIISSLVGSFRKEPFTTTLVARLFFLPFDVVNYAGGILKLPFWSYLSATFIGTLLGIATFVSIGASLDVVELRNSGFTAHVIDPQLLLLSACIFIISISISKLLKHRRVRSIPED